MEKFIVKHIMRTNVTGKMQQKGYAIKTEHTLDWTDDPFEATQFDAYPQAAAFIEEEKKVANNPYPTMYQIEKVFI